MVLLTVFSNVDSVAVNDKNSYKTKYPGIPIVDVHVHASTVGDINNYLKVSDTIKQKYGANLVFFVGLSEYDNPIAEMKAASNNRFIFAASEMHPHKGLIKTPEEIVSVMQDRFIGLKFWFGDPSRVIDEGEAGIDKIDDPRLDHFFTTMECNNVLMTSLHIADPNEPFGVRQNWMKDPVYYWEQIRAFENIVAKYHKLIIVAAHMAWCICQDAQVDYLRYMLSKYPNLYLDTSAIYQYFPLLNHDNLRDFFIEYQDRILYGSDFGRFQESGIQSTADRFAVHFAIHESDQMVDGGFIQGQVKGLKLPKEVLEKIYYKNAMKLYPSLKEVMGIR